MKALDNLGAKGSLCYILTELFDYVIVNVGFEKCLAYIPHRIGNVSFGDSSAAGKAFPLLGKALDLVEKVQAAAEFFQAALDAPNDYEVDERTFVEKNGRGQPTVTSVVTTVIHKETCEYTIHVKLTVHETGFHAGMSTQGRDGNVKPNARCSAACQPAPRPRTARPLEA